MNLNEATTSELFKYMVQNELYDAHFASKGFMCNVLNTAAKTGLITYKTRDHHVDAIDAFMKSLAKYHCITMHNAIYAYVEKFYDNSGEYPTLMTEDIHNTLNKMYADWDNAKQYVIQYEQSIRTEHWESN